jgi:hypothetical protein
MKEDGRVTKEILAQGGRQINVEHVNRYLQRYLHKETMTSG